jgi:hypothetical protein
MRSSVAAALAPVMTSAAAAIANALEREQVSIRRSYCVNAAGRSQVTRGPALAPTSGVELFVGPEFGTTTTVIACGAATAAIARRGRRLAGKRVADKRAAMRIARGTRVV